MQYRHYQSPPQGTIPNQFHPHHILRPSFSWWVLMMSSYILLDLPCGPFPGNVPVKVLFAFFVCYGQPKITSRFHYPSSSLMEYPKLLTSSFVGPNVSWLLCFQTCAIYARFEGFHGGEDGVWGAARSSGTFVPYHNTVLRHNSEDLDLKYFNLCSSLEIRTCFTRIQNNWKNCCMCVCVSLCIFNAPESSTSVTVYINLSQNLCTTYALYG